MRWYAGLAPRERRLVTIGGILLALLVLYLAVVDPLVAARARAAQRASNARATLNFLDNAGARLAAAGPVAGGAVGHLAAGQSVLAAVSTAARSGPVSGSVQRIEQAGNGGARLTVKDAPFDALVGWLGSLQSSDGIVVVDANIQQAEQPGTVNGTLTLNTGS